MQFIVNTTKILSGKKIYFHKIWGSYNCFFTTTHFTPPTTHFTPYNGLKKKKKCLEILISKNIFENALIVMITVSLHKHIKNCLVFSKFLKLTLVQN